MTAGDPMLRLQPVEKRRGTFFPDSANAASIDPLAVKDSAIECKLRRFGGASGFVVRQQFVLTDCRFAEQPGKLRLDSSC
jgi:hypothetical protein